ncbi:hypothetical protein [Streptomyces longispororuber]|uniref:hypothetical protein n=1 Tax=Streptomyces longispororuber TaxID=68230 RepID=UPI00210B6DAA|nr:hypothetical protein [Streptomyces longispororuber]MCQ4206961.1 hypothetical protein [Streptomyces longispororuber]
MEMERTAAADAAVQAVVVYDGQFLLVALRDGWGLPSGRPEHGESTTVTAERVVYELSGYLVDGTRTLRPAADGTSAVVCQLLSETPSGSGSLAREQLRWASPSEGVDAELSSPVRDYLHGFMPS